ncbi:MAG: tyrosine-type recombinase/integrase [Nocardioidaceae bacterium]
MTATGPSKAAAERALRDVPSRRSAPAGELVTAETRLFDLADLWITGLETEGRIEQSTINEYRRVLDHLVLPSMGGLRLREATRGRLDRLFLKLREQSVNRQRKAKLVLGAMLAIAVRHDAIPVNPARATSRVHRPKQETKALRIDDLVEIRAAVRRWLDADRTGPRANGDIADIIDLMLATGCRIGEVLALRWSDLDLDGDLTTLAVTGTIKTESGKGTYRKSTPKSDASRPTVVLPPFATELLCVRREFATPNQYDAVFATRNGTWHQVVNIERRWRQIRKDTGFEWVTPHTFRKTVATLISEATTSELASRQLGHSSSQVTRDHYIAKPSVAADLSELLETLRSEE